MRDFLNRLLGRTTGFVYVPHNEDGVMKDAHAGARLGHKGPPWIVVLQSPEDVIVTAWPGKLWRVRVLKRASEQPLSHAGYVRADAVDVIAEAPRGLPFGQHGEAVAEVLDAAAALTPEIAQRLADAQPRDAGDAYSRVWNRWLSNRGASHPSEDHSHTLAIGGRQSPIFGGLMAVEGIVFKRAIAAAGDAASRVVDEDVYLSPPWNGASEALLHVALATGAPQFCEGGDAALLTTSWRGVFSTR